MYPGDADRIAGSQHGADIVGIVYVFEHNRQIRLSLAQNRPHPVQTLFTYRTFVVRVIIHVHVDDSTGAGHRAQLGKLGAMSEIDERWKESNSALVSVIRDEILEAGPIRFDRFMELALYHPEFGYYRSQDPAPGRSGDFLTAPEAHPIFGATLARQIETFESQLDHPDTFSIVEYGAGSGRLIRPLLASLRHHSPDLYERVRYMPIELNTVRLTELKTHLEEGGHAARISISVPEGGVTGCVIANEFVDAFPARRVTMTGDGLMEITVDWENGWFAESHVPVEDDAPAAYIERHGFELTPGDTIEFHPGIRGWVEGLTTTLADGFVLLIDYGYPAEELFRDHRRAGTLKGYYQHGVTEQIFRGIGRQDLTAHVNFSEISYHAQTCGFTIEEMTTQAELLEKLGIGERMFELQSNPNITSDEYLAVRAAVLRMIDPGAMGRFRAMILRRNSL
jgi:SAM-dependent MidA family methyltransferase